MEPADERREHLQNDNALFESLVAPQWSPPMIGGSTPRRGRQRRRADTAAMEPADERREHLQLGPGRQPEFAAAMEAADDRREHVPTGTLGVNAMPPPQWSPPMIGGSTPAQSQATHLP